MSFVLVLCVWQRRWRWWWWYLLLLCVVVVDDDDVNVFGSVDGLLRVVMAGCPRGLSVY